jgi:heptose-I-phosphate ethanolaminephosphotransferase
VTRWKIDKFETRIEPAVPWQMAVAITVTPTTGRHAGHARQRQQIPPLTTSRTHGRPARDPGAGHRRIHQPSAHEPVRLSAQTTPELDKLKDQLAVFDNVITPRPYTIEALQQVLTFADEENPDLYLSTPSLVSMMKQAGYKTFWITNQQTMTKRNTMLTTFSEQADEQVYLNNNRNQNAASTTAT